MATETSWPTLDASMSHSHVLSGHFSLSEWSKLERLEKRECFSGNPDSSDSEAFNAEDVNYAWGVEPTHADWPHSCFSLL